jgi:hypothetical protein
VRYKAIVQGLISSPLPQEHLTSFLVTLLEDDNYFPENFFYEQVEEAILKQRNTLKGTRNMIIFYEREEDFINHPSIPNSQNLGNFQHLLRCLELTTTIAGSSTDAGGEGGEGVSNPPSNNNNTIEDSSNNNNNNQGATSTTVIIKLYVYFPLIRMFLFNIIFVRVLLGKLLLSPWNNKLCKPPVNRYTRKVIKQLRMMMTLCYLLARKINPGLLSLADMQQIFQTQLQMKKTNVNNNNNNSSSHRPSSAVVAVTINNDRIGTANNNNNNQNGRGGNVTAVTNNNTVINESNAPTTDTSPVVAAAVGPLKPPEKGIYAKLLKWTGLGDTTPGYESFEQDSLEYYLVRPRLSYYDSLDFIARCLVYDPWILIDSSSTNTNNMTTTSSSSSSLADNEWNVALLHEMDHWLDESVSSVRDWLDRLTMHVLHNYFMKHKTLWINLCGHNNNNNNGKTNYDNDVR